MSSASFFPERLGEARERPAEPGFGGGPDGNEQLTAATGVLLIALLAVLGVTIVAIGQLTWLHLFLGLALIGPVALKMASTGYRFARYYTHNPAYRRKGPPATWLRMLAPAVVLSTAAVFITGVVLLFEGPAHRDPWMLWHKVIFFIWIAVTALHVLGHLLELPASLRATGLDRSDAVHRQRGDVGRVLALTGATVGGLVLAIALIPDFGTWTAHLSLLHHRH